MYFINTRPQQNNLPLTQALQQLGQPVLELPLLQLQALPLEEKLIEQFQQLTSIDLIVVVSPIAVEIGFAYLKRLFTHDYELILNRLQQISWVAVGKATQKKLLEYGVSSISPQVETSEGMLDLAVFDFLNGQHGEIKRVAIWRGIGGRTLLLQQLQQHGCDVLNMLLYQRAMPEYNIQQLQKLLNSLPAHILISSEQSWHHWLQLQRDLQSQQLIADNMQLLWQNHYLVLGERVTQRLQNDYLQHRVKGVLQLSTLQTLQADEIVQKINAWQGAE
ncbi:MULTISPECIES: uroporphyrinogen-III synthase [unclassified Acinetobacter]|uniref:uroporphyrinogen-III synthase n=1 Tax=unclassified Acinetobacter TaxID=196816 RepID=UPI0035BA9D88